MGNPEFTGLGGILSLWFPFCRIWRLSSCGSHSDTETSNDESEIIGGYGRIVDLGGPMILLYLYNYRSGLNVIGRILGRYFL